MKANLPFTALRTFESVARLRGFGRAAEELGVTQSAVSQHVKSLEEWLGRRLLTRGIGRATATSEGTRLAAAVANGFGDIANLCHEMRDSPTEPLTINLSCLPGFAYNWLFPRLINFDQRHPDYPVSIATTDALTTFADGDADIAIRYGLGGYGGLHVERLMPERLFPVCAPSLLASGPPLETPEDLSGHTLLYDEIADIGGNPPTWDYWAKAIGASTPKPARSRRFGQSNMVVQAAIQGFGVALGREPLVIDALTDGHLVRPFPDLIPSQFSYWIVCPVAAQKSERIRAFRDWLHTEAAQQPPITDASLARRQDATPA
ncbi:MAG: LysR substrate-binding domain-containing protein [Paracoccaceae bacterium]|nr:LysR substrate-binding domain-containing protein [Paracoccaceae bacterium]